MAMKFWQDHSVQVELFGNDAKPTQGYATYLAEQFAERGVFTAVVRAGLVDVRSDPDSPVTAADVAASLARAELPAAAVHERTEWSVGKT